MQQEKETERVTSVPKLIRTRSEHIRTIREKKKEQEKRKHATEKKQNKLEQYTSRHDINFD